MRDSDSPSQPVRPCGVGFCVDSPQLYVWDVDAREAASSAAELRGDSVRTGAPYSGR